MQKSYKNIIGIFGVPRSGTTWLGEMFDSCPEVRYKYQPFFSYEFKDKINVNSDKREIENFFLELYEKEDAFLDQTENRKLGIYPSFDNRTDYPQNLAFKEVRYLYMAPTLLKNVEGLKLMFIIRNPISVLESWINAPKEFKGDWNIYDEWYFAVKKNEYRPENYFGYHKWKEAVSMFAYLKKEYPNQVSLVKYEDLYEDATQVAKKLFKLHYLEFSNQTEEFLFNSQERFVDNPYSVFRSSKGVFAKQKKFLPEKIKNYILTDLEYFSEAKDFHYNQGDN